VVESQEKAKSRNFILTKTNLLSKCWFWSEGRGYNY